MFGNVSRHCVTGNFPLFLEIPNKTNPNQFERKLSRVGENSIRQALFNIIFLYDLVL